MLDGIVVRIRAGELVAERFDDGVGALESKIRIAHFERESEVNLLKRCGVLQYTVGEIDSFDLIVDGYLLRYLRTACPARFYYDTSANRAGMSFLNGRAGWTFDFAALNPAHYELVDFVRCIFVHKFAFQLLVVYAVNSAGFRIDADLVEAVF